MTIERAIKMLEAKLECMTRDVSGIYDDCNCKRCNECNLNYEQGNMGEQKEYLKMSIYALKVFAHNTTRAELYEFCKNIIDEEVNKK